MENFKNYRVIIKTGTPIVLTQFAPSFDALIYEAMEQNSLLNQDQILEEMKSIIKWNEELGIFHASAMRFIVNEQHAVTRKNYVRATTQKDLFRSENFKPNGKRGYSAIQTEGGAFKKRLTERLSYSAIAVCFDVVCDQLSVKRLLNNAFIGVGYDAFSSGSGQITSIEFLEMEEDVSIMLNGQARCNIPCSKVTLTSMTAMTPILPPYYCKDKSVNAYVPPRFDTLPEHQISLAL